MSFKAASVVFVLAAALVSTSSASPLKKPGSPKNSTSGISPRAGFPNSYQRYFVYNDEPVTFIEACQKCRAHGLRLASVHSALDDVKLRAALAQEDINQRGPWWIAGTDTGMSGSFELITGNQRLGARSGYTNFAPGEPNNVGGDEHCLEVGGGPWGTLWNDAVCDQKKRYICELDSSLESF
ncbi:perlucin-like [Culex pipiens pallens]|uniref:perlucin-like n=1 Tax=Culex pipiens pallens TaxID=42434 RepID=UPI001952EE4A|nr:perlucin-like [Culex pipiens pallens]